MVKSNLAPRYALLTTALRQGIEEGRYPTGTSLPTESELCAQYDVSRHTVREALRQLRNMGLVASRQGCGTVVMSTSVSPHYIQSLDSLEDFVDFLRQAQGKVLAAQMAKMPVDVANDFELSSASEKLWLNLEIIRYWGKDNLPTLLSEVYIDGKYSALKDYYDTTVPLSHLLENKYGIVPALIEQEIKAVVLNKRQSEILKTKHKAPALQSIRRCCTAHGEILVISRNTSPANRYTYSTKMRITLPPKE